MDPIVADPNQDDMEFLREAIPEDEPVIDKLSQHVDKVWQKNLEDFKPVRNQMALLLKRSKGEYDNKKAAAIKAFKGTDIYIRNLETKCRSAESWIKDIYRGDSDYPWVLQPTTVPDLPDEKIEEVKQAVLQEAMVVEQQLVADGKVVDKNQVAKIIQEYYEQKVEEAKEEISKDAKERCELTAKEIRDDNEEGGWNKAFKDFLWYYTRLPFAVIKGPILTKKKKQVWVPQGDTYAIEAQEVLAHDVYCVSPFNIFPASGVKELNDGDIIEVHELTKESLYDLIGVSGYDSDRIRMVLRELESGKLKAKWFTIEGENEIKRAIQKIPNYPTNPPTQNTSFQKEEDLVYAQELTGTVKGSLLMEWGVEEQLDPDRQYHANCWKIGKHVIKAVLNPDSLGRKPYHSTSWAKNPETYVGEGLLEFGAPVEDALNAVARALINNIAIASGPMAEVDKDRVDTRIPIYPWRVVESTSLQMKTEGPAVNYYQPQMHCQELITAYKFLSQVLDEMTVPAYTQGQNQVGVTSGTATVFTELLAAASRSIKATVANVDDDIIEPYISMCYDYKMQFSDNPDIKGDARVVAKGVHGLQIKEQQAQRKIEYLQLAMTPVMSQILGPENLGSIAAQIAKANNISLPDMKRLEGVQDIEQVIQQMLMAQAGVDPIQQNGQVANGGGAVAKPQGTNPDGSKAGVNNAA